MLPGEVLELDLATFATFAIASQTILLTYFACRRWFLPIAEKYGWAAYAFGVIGLAVGVWLLLVGSPWQLFVGPTLFAAWAAFGLWVDVIRRMQWRPTTDSHQPLRWNVLGPYITLYLAAQMFLWWPLWDRWRLGWAIYLVLFIANTGLNIAGHFRPASNSSAQPA